MAVLVNILTTYNGAGSKKALRELATLEKQATLAGNGVAAGMFKASAGMQKAGAQMATIGAGMSKAITLPIVAIGAVSVVMAAKFESSMKLIQTQAGGSAKDVEVLSAAVLELGAKGQHGPQELSAALYHLKSVGMDNVTAMKALTQSEKLASVGGSDLEATTNAVAGAYKSGIKGAQTFGATVGTLNAIIGAGNLRMEDLNSALGTGFLVTAQTFGVSLTSVGGALAMMTSRGIPATRAAMALKMTFSALAAPSAVAEKAFGKIGLNSKKLAEILRSKGLGAALGEIKEHLKGMSKTEQSIQLTKMFGAKSSQAILTLLGNLKDYDRTQKQIADNAGKFAALAAAQSKDATAKWDHFKSSMSSAAILIGNQLLPTAISLADKLGAVGAWLNKLSPGTRKWVVQLGLVLAVGGPVLLILGKMMVGIGKLIGGLAKVTLAFGKGGAAAPKYARAIAGATKGLASFVKQGALAVVSTAKQGVAWAVHAAKQASYTAMGISLMVKDAAAKVAATAATAAHTVATVASAVATKAAAAGQWLLNAAMSANPIGLIIVAITALVGVFVLLWTKCDWFRSFWIAVWEEVKAVAAAVWPTIKAVGEQIVAALQWTWDAVSAAVTWFWNWAGAFITAGITTWWTIIKKTVATIVTAVQAAWTAISTAVKWFWNWAGPFITAGVKTWWTIIKTTFEAVKLVTSLAWDAIKVIVSSAIGKVKAAIHAVDSVVAFVRGVWDRVHGAAVTVWGTITGAVRSAIGNVKSAIHAVESVVAFVRGVFNDINSVASSVGHRIAATVGDIWRGIKGVAKNVWDGIVGVVKDAWNNIKGFANDIIDVINHVVKVVPGLGNNVPGYPFPEFAVGGAANGPSTGYPVIMHGRETVVAHDNPGRGLADLAGSGILGGGKKAPRVSASALTFETRGPHVGADGDSGGRSILGSIGSALGSAADWVGNLVSKYNLFNMLPKPVGGLFGGATNALLGMVKDAIVGLLEKFGLGDRQKIVNFAKSQLGMPYVWGGASPAAGGFDCSGLMQWAYRQAGHNVQWRVPTYGGHQIPRGAVQPADIMFYYPGAIQNGQRVPFGHFKMYAGDGQTIESTSGGVQMRAADWAGAAQIRQYLSKGGYVPRTAGGLATVLGEGDEGEWVVPESKVGRFAAAALAGDSGPTVIEKHSHTHVHLPGGTVLAGTAQEIADILAPYIEQSQDLTDNRDARGR